MEYSNVTVLNSISSTPVVLHAILTLTQDRENNGSFQRYFFGFLVSITWPQTFAAHQSAESHHHSSLPFVSLCGCSDVFRFGSN